MNAGDPIRFGFKLCAKCRTWRDPRGLIPSPESDTTWGAPLLVCRELDYCKRAQSELAAREAV
jgi:hypothetical protein